MGSSATRSHAGSSRSRNGVGTRASRWTRACTTTSKGPWAASAASMAASASSREAIQPVAATVAPRSRKLSAASGFENIDLEPITFDEIRPGCWIQKERLVDMANNHVDASLCFPNVLPRFCGQAFLERDDKELALLCVQAYNDWMIDEWCAGDAKDKLIPLTIIPLWDPTAAAEEVRRCADKGSHAVAFSENPSPLG